MWKDQAVLARLHESLRRRARRSDGHVSAARLEDRLQDRRNNFDVLRLLLGPRLIDRWEMWKPSIDAMPGDYPMFRSLVAKMRTTLGTV